MNLRSLPLHWSVGTLVAFAGVAVARGLAPQVAEPAHAWAAVAGELLALGGLAVIALGVRRRLRRAAAAAQDGAAENAQPS